MKLFAARSKQCAMHAVRSVASIRPYNIADVMRKNKCIARAYDHIYLCIVYKLYEQVVGYVATLIKIVFVYTGAM